MHLWLLAHTHCISVHSAAAAAPMCICSSCCRQVQLASSPHALHAHALLLHRSVHALRLLLPHARVATSLLLHTVLTVARTASHHLVCTPMHTQMHVHWVSWPRRLRCTHRTHTLVCISIVITMPTTSYGCVCMCLFSISTRHVLPLRVSNCIDAYHAQLQAVTYAASSPAAVCVAFIAHTHAFLRRHRTRFSLYDRHP